jgi:hypothetical protein
MSTTYPPSRPSGQRAPVATPQELGIGMRFSLHPHSDDFAAVILGALRAVADAGLTDGLLIDTDEVSTYVGAASTPAEQRLIGYLAAVIAAASRRSGNGHVVAHVLLSRGCPGETTCDLAVTGLPSTAPIEVPATGLPALAQWSLYPLLDSGSDAGTHMEHIESAIASALQRGTGASAAHYATMLRGDVAQVLATAADAWSQVGVVVAHVVCHLTISVGSPTAAAAR